MAARVVGVAVTGLALAANAFMIPSTMVLDDEQSAQLENIHLASAPPSRVILDLPCPECGLVNDGTEEALRLDFAISQDRQSIELSGHPFFPHPRELSVYTTNLEDDSPDSRFTSQPIFYHTSVNSVEAADGADAQLIDIDFQITGLEKTDVTVDKVSLRLLHDDEKGFTIADIVVVPFDGSAPEGLGVNMDEPEELEFSILPIEVVTPPHELLGSRPSQPHDDEDLKKAHEQPECHGPEMLCRLKSIIDNKIGMMRETIEKQMANHRPHPHGKKPCPGMRLRPVSDAFDPSSVPDTPTAPVPVKGGPAKFWGMGHPHPHPHHRGGRHGHGRHHRHGPISRLVHAAERLFVGFVVPVFIGIAAGMVASVLGLVVGTCVAWLWIKLVRGGRGVASASRAPKSSASAQEAGEAGEKTGLMEAVAADEEPLPVYAEKE